MTLMSNNLKLLHKDKGCIDVKHLLAKYQPILKIKTAAEASNDFITKHIRKLLNC